jgi:hypothetical protein
MYFIMEAAQPPSQFLSDLCIEGAKRFIEQENLRFNSKCPG